MDSVPKKVVNIDHLEMLCAKGTKFVLFQPNCITCVSATNTFHFVSHKVVGNVYYYC